MGSNEASFAYRFVSPESQYHPTITITNELIDEYKRYLYAREQLALNETRSGFTLVDPERAEHILNGTPIYRAARAELAAYWDDAYRDYVNTLRRLYDS